MSATIAKRETCLFKTHSTETSQIHTGLTSKMTASNWRRLSHSRQNVTFSRTTGWLEVALNELVACTVIGKGGTFNRDNRNLEFLSSYLLQIIPRIQEVTYSKQTLSRPSTCLHGTFLKAEKGTPYPRPMQLTPRTLLATHGLYNCTQQLWLKPYPLTFWAAILWKWCTLAPGPDVTNSHKNYTQNLSLLSSSWTSTISRTGATRRRKTSFFLFSFFLNKKDGYNICLVIFLHANSQDNLGKCDDT